MVYSNFFYQKNNIRSDLRHMVYNPNRSLLPGILNEDSNAYLHSLTFTIRNVLSFEMAEVLLKPFDFDKTNVAEGCCDCCGELLTFSFVYRLQ